VYQVTFIARNATSANKTDTHKPDKQKQRQHRSGGDKRTIPVMHTICIKNVNVFKEGTGSCLTPTVANLQQDLRWAVQ
jgi:hypothetical protein